MDIFSANSSYAMEHSSSCLIDNTMNNFIAENAMDSVNPHIDLRREYQYPSEYHYSTEMPQVTGAPNFDNHFQSTSDIEKQQYLQTLDFDNNFYPNYGPETFQEKSSQIFFHGIPNVDKYNLPPDGDEERFPIPFTEKTSVPPEVENLSVYFEESRQLWQNILQNHFLLHPEEEKSSFDSGNVEKSGNFLTIQNEPQMTAEERTMIDQSHANSDIYSSENEKLRWDLSSNRTVAKRKASHIEYSPNNEKCLPDNSMEASCPPSKILRSERSRSLEKESCYSPRLSIDEKVFIPDRSMDLRNIYLQISFDKQRVPPESDLDRKGYPLSNPVGGNNSSLPILMEEKSNFPESSNGRKFCPKIIYDERNHSSKAPCYENNQKLPGNEMKFSSGSPNNPLRNSFPFSDMFNKDSYHEQRSCLPYENSSSQDLRSHHYDVVRKVKNFVNGKLNKRIHDHHFKDAAVSTPCCQGPKARLRKLLQERFARRCCYGRPRHHYSHRDNMSIKLDPSNSRNNLGDEPIEILTKHNSQSKFHKVLSQSEANKVQCYDNTDKKFNVPILTKSRDDQNFIYVRSKEEINDSFIKTKDNVDCPNITSNDDIKIVYNYSENESTKSEIKLKEMLGYIRQNNTEKSELKDESRDRSDTILNKFDSIALDHSYCKLSEPMEIIID